MGLSLESREIAKCLSELVYKLARLETEKLTRDDFLDLIRRPMIAKQVDENVRRCKIVTKSKKHNRAPTTSVPASTRRQQVSFSQLPPTQTTEDSWCDMESFPATVTPKVDDMEQGQTSTRSHRCPSYVNTTENSVLQQNTWG